MEKENFDEELNNRIKQVFETYNDGAADDGWNRLREKYPEKKRRDVVFWWLGSAAALFLIAFLFWFSPDFQQNQIVKTVKKQASDTSIATDYSTKKTDQLLIASDSIGTKKTPVKTASGWLTKRHSDQLQTQSQQFSTETAGIKKTPVKTASAEITNQNYIALQRATADSFLDTQKTPVKTVSELAIMQSSNQQKQNQQANTIQTLKTGADNQQSLLITVTAKNIKDSIAKPINILTNNNIQKQPLKTTLASTKQNVVSKEAKAAIAKKTTEDASKFSLGLYAGSHVNYSSGSNNQMGLGAGVSTDFRLSRNIKLSTGLGLLQNNLTYTQHIPTQSLYAASYSYASAAPASTSGSSTGTVVQATSLSSMDASLLALDIPVNLTYQFLSGKNSISISAGVSSNTLAREVYDYHYAAASTSSLSGSGQTVQNSTNFNRFNFANTLNLAAGFAYPLGTNKLQIEPFFKYPLSGSGSQQLFFGSAGINLKLNIQTQKK